MPVLKLSATFAWAPPGAGPSPGGAAPEFTVVLYTDGSVNIVMPAPVAGVVTGLEWVDASSAVLDHGGSSGLPGAWDEPTKRRFLRAATNVLRQQMGMPSQVISSEWPAAGPRTPGRSG